MKKLLLACLFVFLATAFGAGAQEWKEKRHSLSLTVGPWPVTADRESFGSSYDDYNPWGIHDIYTPDGRTFYGSMKTCGAISLTYNYRVLKWLRWDSSVTYTGFYRKSYIHSDGNVGKKNISRHYFYTMTGVSAVWLDRGMVELYSGFELGPGFAFTKDSHYPKNKVTFGGNITYLGIKIGRDRWYGMAELSAGMKGILNGGVGYRF